MEAMTFDEGWSEDRQRTFNSLVEAAAAAHSAMLNGEQSIDSPVSLHLSDPVSTFNRN